MILLTAFEGFFIVTLVFLGTEAVRNGIVVSKQEFDQKWRFLVSIEVSDLHPDFGYTYYPICSGTIISQHIVLTAGHCLISHDPDDLSVKSYLHSLKIDRHDVEKYFIHEGYDFVSN